MHNPTDRIAHIISFVTPAGTRNSSMGPPCGIYPMTHCTISSCSTTEFAVCFNTVEFCNIENFIRSFEFHAINVIWLLFMWGM